MMISFKGLSFPRNSTSPRVTTMLSGTARPGYNSNLCRRHNHHGIPFRAHIRLYNPYHRTYPAMNDHSNIQTYSEEINCVQNLKVQTITNYSEIETGKAKNWINSRTPSGPKLRHTITNIHVCTYHISNYTSMYCPPRALPRLNFEYVGM